AEQEVRRLLAHLLVLRERRVDACGALRVGALAHEGRVVAVEALRGRADPLVHLSEDGLGAGHLDLSLTHSHPRFDVRLPREINGAAAPRVARELVLSAMWEWPEPVERVARFLREAGAEARVEEFPAGTPTAEDAARAVGCELAQI